MPGASPHPSAQCLLHVRAPTAESRTQPQYSPEIASPVPVPLLSNPGVGEQLLAPWEQRFHRGHPQRLAEAAGTRQQPAGVIQTVRRKQSSQRVRLDNVQVARVAPEDRKLGNVQGNLLTLCTPVCLLLRHLERLSPGDRRARSYSTGKGEHGRDHDTRYTYGCRGGHAQHRSTRRSSAHRTAPASRTQGRPHRPQGILRFSLPHKLGAVVSFTEARSSGDRALSIKLTLAYNLAAGSA